MNTATALHRVRRVGPQSLLVVGIFAAFTIVGLWLQAIGSVVAALLG